MKKIIIISISILLVLALAIVAYGAIGEIFQDSTESGSRFEQMVRTMERTIEDPREFNDLLFNFEFLREGYGLSDADMDFIADLVIEGRNMSDVIHIAYFWLDTNEDISIIREIYDVKEGFGDSRLWIDFAFNAVTYNRHGSLSDEEVQEYLEMGLEFEDIHIARILSRLGVMTIHEILDEIAEGAYFSELAAEIDSAPTVRRNRSRVRVDRERGGRHRNLRNQSDVLMSRRLSMVTGEDLEVFLEVAESLEEYETLDVLFENATEQIAQDVMANLRGQGVLRRPRYGFPGEEEAVARLREKILENGISERTLNRLFDEGFSYEYIWHASTIVNGTNRDIGDLLERLRNGEDWIQIIESEGIQ